MSDATGGGGAGGASFSPSSALREFAPHPYQSLDESGEVVAVNDAWLDALGYDRKDVEGEPFGEFLTDESRKRFESKFEEFKEAGGVSDVELEMCRADGDPIVVSYDGQVEYDDDGDPVRTHCQFHDVTEQRRREETLTETNTVLRTLLESLPMGVLAENPDRNIIAANEALCEIFELPIACEELVGRDCAATAEESKHLFEDPETFLDRIEEILEGRERVLGEELAMTNGRTVARSYVPFSFSNGEGNLWLYRDVTDEKQREQQLKAERNRAERIFEAAGTIMLVLDDDGRVERINDRGCDRLGYEREELIGEDWFETAVPEDRRPDVDDVFESLTANGTDPVEVNENPVVTKDGERRIVRWHNSLLRDSDGNVSGVLSSGTDVTEGKRRERELERHEAYLEQSHDVITVVDADGTVKFQTESTERVTGFAPEEVTGDEGFEYVHPEDRSELTELFSSIVERPDEEATAELRVETADGSWRWLEARGVNKLDDPVVDGIVVSSRDITGRKRREQELEELNERLDLALEAGQFGVWDWNVRTDEVTFDGRWAEMLGYSLDEVEPRLDFWKSRVHPEDEERVQAALESHLQGTTEYYECDHRMRTKSGRWIWIHDVGKVVERDGDGDPVRAVGIHQDVTRRKEKEEELRRQNERLNEFASVISHDLRNPLSVAQGRATLLREECDSAHGKPLVTALDRMEVIVEDTLTLARQGQKVGRPEWVGLPDLVGKCWGMVDTRDATLEFADEVAVKGDRNRLQHVFENLFRNAVEHGGDDVTVRVGQAGENGIYVEDDGPGIPADEREKVLEPGHTSAADGTGFGLTIVRRIAEAHGWDVAVTESDAGGARFEFRGVEIGDPVDG